MAGVLATLPLTASSAATVPPAVSPGTDPANGFPQWYQDNTGTRVAPCLDPADANCIVAADAGFDPAKPMVFPTNFPSEFFYLNAQSDRLATPGCKGAKPGRISIINNLEGAFANGAPKFGDQMVFGRVRLILTGGLCPKSTYQVTAPYGSFSFTTDASGALPRNQGTTDVGCAPVAPNVCDFTLALNSPNAKSFLRWDPAVAPAAPSGYLGDGVTLHRIIGGTNGNAFTVTGPGSRQREPHLDHQPVHGRRQEGRSVVGDAGRRGLRGRAGREPEHPAHGHGDQPGRHDGHPRTGDPRRRQPRRLHDHRAGLRRPAGRQGRDLHGVGRLRPGGSGLRAALGDPGRRPRLLRRRRSGCRCRAPRPSRPRLRPPRCRPSSIDFGSQRITFSTTDRDVTVTNTGTAPLDVSGAQLSGSDPTQYSVVSHCADPVAPGGTCTLTVSFSPTALGASAASLDLTTNATPAVVSVPLTGTGIGGHAAVSADTTFGFANWYQDEAGVRLSQCNDPADPNCVVLPGGTFDGTNPDLSFPDNFPDEYFYYVADSDLLSTPGCNGTAPGKLLFRFAVEAAFLNGGPVDGDQMTFGRVRLRSTGGLCPNHTYTVVTPYGSWDVTAEADGSLRVATNTSDVGCTPAPGAPCDFSLALRSPVLGGFLRWDPSALPAPPNGYIGDPNVLHTVVGAPYSRDGQPVNYVAMYDGAVDAAHLVAKTDKFLVMGQLDGPLVANPSNVVFPNPLSIGAAPASSTVTLSNQGIDPITVNGFSVTGVAAGSFSVGTSTCQTALAPGDTCTVEVLFAPVDVGTQNAALVVDHTGLNSPMSVPLSGVGTADGTAALSVDRTSVAFAQLHTGRTSPPQQLGVSNIGGTAPLTLGDLGITGAGAGSFSVGVGDCPAQIAIGETCHLEVRFAPLAAGDLTAVLTVNGLPRRRRRSATCSCPGPASPAPPLCRRRSRRATRRTTRTPTACGSLRARTRTTATAPSRPTRR